MTTLTRDSTTPRMEIRTTRARKPARRTEPGCGPRRGAGSSRDALRRCGWQPGQTVCAAELDAVLDVDAAAFDRTVERVADELFSLDVELGPMDGALAPESDSVEARAYEYRMARRYVLLKKRAERALRELPYADAQIAATLRSGRLPEAAAVPARDPRRVRAVRALRDLVAVRNRCVESALPIVPSCIRRYRNMGVDDADLIQEGNAALFQAVDGFDWRYGVRFKTYAQYWVVQALLKSLYNTSRTVRVPVWAQKSLAKLERRRERARRADGTLPPAEEIGEELGMSEERVHELLKIRRRAVSLDAQRDHENESSLAHAIEDARLGPITDSLEEGDLAQRLRDAMAHLPDRERMILRRRFGLGGRDPETLAQIAVDLDVTAERVRQLEKSALARMQKAAKNNRLVQYL